MYSELKTRGDEYSGAALAVKRTEKRKCRHSAPISGSECIADIIGTFRV